MALARAILANRVLSHVVGVAVGTIAASPRARRLCCDALADLERDGHSASAALQLAMCAARIDGVLR